MDPWAPGAHSVSPPVMAQVPRSRVQTVALGKSRARWLPISLIVALAGSEAADSTPDL